MKRTLNEIHQAALVVAIVSGLASVLLMVLATVANAKVTYYEANHTAIIEGQTDETQMLEVWNLFEREDVHTVFMRGPGGHLYAGLRIGELIQQEGASVVIGRGDLCISACAFAAMASPDVRIYGELWLHRPYVPMYPTHTRLDDISGLSLEASAIISRYFVQIGYPISLWARIASGTNPCYFMAVTSKTVLDKMRGDPLDIEHPIVVYRNRCDGTPFGGS